MVPAWRSRSKRCDFGDARDVDNGAPDPPGLTHDGKRERELLLAILLDPTPGGSCDSPAPAAAVPLVLGTLPCRPAEQRRSVNQ